MLRCAGGRWSGLSATARPAVSSTALPAISRTPAPAWPTAAGATASAPPPPIPPASPPGGSASPPRCPASPPAPPGWSWSTSTPTAASSRRDLATGLLPGIDLAAEPIPRDAWDDPARFRDGRDTLTLLARLRGGPRPWPAGSEHQPVTAATPSGGVAPVVPGARRRAPPGPRRPPRPVRAGLASRRQSRLVLRHRPRRRHHRRHLPRCAAATPPSPAACPPGSPARSSASPPQPRPLQLSRPLRSRPGGSGPAAYLATVIGRDAAQLAAMTDGRKRALSALAYHGGGLLAWSGLDREHVVSQLVDAGHRRRARTRHQRPHRQPRRHQRNRPANNPTRFARSAMWSESIGAVPPWSTRRSSSA